MTQAERQVEGASLGRNSPVFARVVRRIRTASARELVLPLLAFLAPILVLEAVQCQAFGCSLFLGWDSSTYAWWAVLVQARGVPAAVAQWNYPHLYVLLLSGFGWLIGSVSTAEHILAVLVGLPLGYAFYRLTTRLTGDRRLGIFAALLGGISVGTIYLVADLQRNLLAFGIALPLGASIYADLFSGRTRPGRLWPKAVFVWIPLLFVVLGTQIETYVVLGIALLLASFLSRNARTCLKGILLLSAPVAIASPLITGFLTGYTSETSRLLPFTLVDVYVGVWLYLSGFAIVPIVIGIVALNRKARELDPTARFLGLWLVALAVLAPVAVAIHIPPTRLLLLVPVPILLVLSFPTVHGWIRRAWDSIRRAVRIRRRASDSSVDPPPAPPVAGWLRGPACLSLAIFVLVAPLAFTTIVNKDQFLVPYVTQTAVDQLTQAGRAVKEMGYSNAILVLFGSPSAYYAPIYRAYFGMQVPNNLVYYGRLQFLFSLQDSAAVYNWRFDPSVESAYASNYALEIASTIGLSGIPSWPIVIAGGETYLNPPPEPFLSRFERSPGVYVIPPGALTAQELDSWRLFGYLDCYACGQGSPNPSGWSAAPETLQYVNLSASASFNASYIFSLQHAWTSANFSIRVWDWPASVPDRSGTTVTLAPLDVYLDGRLLLTHSYGGLGAEVVTAPVGAIAPGIHFIEVRSSAPGSGVIVTIDELDFTPIA